MTPVVAEARRWIGTPFVHQASLRGAGCDCLGLIRGIWRHLHGAEPVAVSPYPLLAGAARTEDLWAALRDHLAGVDDLDPGPGQILLFRLQAGSPARHLGVMSQAGHSPEFIHAYARHGVVACPLSDPWARRIVARFAFQKD